MEDQHYPSLAQELLQAVRLLGAAFPRASWSDDTEAVYVMAMAQEGVTPSQARAAVRKLICESYELPPVAALLATVRSMVTRDALADWRCPKCGSDKVAGMIGGPAVCFDCGWEGVLQPPTDTSSDVSTRRIPPGFAEPRGPAKAFEPTESGAA